MKNLRLIKYLAARRKAGISRSGEQINTDKKTDQDFPGYPHGTASEKMITPESKTDQKLANVQTRDGEKMLRRSSKKDGKINEESSDGSANAFEGTETVNIDRE